MIDFFDAPGDLENGQKDVTEDDHGYLFLGGSDYIV